MKNISYQQKWKYVHYCRLDNEYLLPEDYDINFIRVSTADENYVANPHTILYIDATHNKEIRVIELCLHEKLYYNVYEVSATSLLYLLITYNALYLLVYTALASIRDKIIHRLDDGCVV